ncbi:MAG: acyl carrier protein [Oscillospiraceae bacterium]|nr:acyl carrier protein [Oscillospiraceae bacterium]
MTRAEVFEKLTEVFCDVFDDDAITLSEDTTAADVEGWDSVEHFNLISEVESVFKLRFQMREVSGMKNVGELVDIILARGAKS